MLHRVGHAVGSGFGTSAGFQRAVTSVLVVMSAAIVLLGLWPQGREAVADDPPPPPPTSVTLDLDVDSDNNNGLDNPDCSAAEDLIEEYLPGKYIMPNTQPGEYAPMLLDLHDPTAAPSAAQGAEFCYILRVTDYDDNEMFDRVAVHLLPDGGSLTEIQLYDANDPQDPNAIYAHTVWLLGDMDRSGTVDPNDVAGFSLALQGQSVYEAAYPPPMYNYFNADCNLDGVVDQADEPAFYGLFGQVRYRPARLFVQGLPDKGGAYTVWAQATCSCTPGSGVCYTDKARVSVSDVCGQPDVQTPPGVPKGYECDESVMDPNISCLENGMDIHPTLCRGPNAYTWDIAPPGNFPPRKRNLVQSSLPLIPGPTQPGRGFDPYPERASIGDVLDLTTGTELLQDIDLELPFGGAVFRHVRTFGNDAWEGWDPDMGTLNGVVDFRKMSWDWNGLGWMMGENPLFLIDYRSGFNVHPNPKRCILILDAHHSIPFIWDNNLEQYVAPPWFDAQMEFDPMYAVQDPNSIDPANPNWETLPHKFYVWLHGGAVKYTIEPFLVKDVDATATEGYHPNWPPPQFTERSEWGKYGHPYFGRVTWIEDTYGNRIENIYCDERYDTDLGVTSECRECCANCKERGQLQAVKLWRPTGEGAGEVCWTLIYTYRSFREYAGELFESTRLVQHALHSIHAYKGDVPVPETCLTLNSYEPGIPCGPVNPDDPEARREYLQAIDNLTHPDLPGDDWVKCVRYIYADRYCTGYLFSRSVHDDCNDLEPAPGEQLVKVTLVERVEKPGLEAQEHETHTLYRTVQDGGYEKMAPPRVRSVYYDAAIRTIIAGAGEPVENVYDVLCLPDSAPVVVTDPVSGKPVFETVHRLADLELCQSRLCGFCAYPDHRQPPHEAFVLDYIGGTIECTRWQARSSLVDRRPGSSTAGRYVIHYYHDYPRSDPSGDCVRTPYSYCPPYDDCPMASLWHHPFGYAWDASNNTHLTADQDHAFYVAFIDQYDVGDTELTELRSRRMVRINTAGMVLSESLWLAGNIDGNSLPDWQKGSYEHYKRDRCGRLLERRTEGWDSPLNENPESQGLIYTFEYDEPECTLICPGPTVWACYPRGGVKAIKVKRGTDGPEYYVEQYQHHPEYRKLVTEHTIYPEPLAEPGLEDGFTTTFEYTFWPLQQIGDPQPPIKTKFTTYPATLRTPGGQPLRAVEREMHDVAGRLTWEGAGSVDSADMPYEFYAVHTTYDDQGRITARIDDENDSNPPGFERVCPLVPAPDALCLTTSYDYEEPFGLKTITYPNGRQQWTFYNVDPPGVPGVDFEVRTYRDIIRGYSGADFAARSPAIISHFSGSRLVNNFEVKLTSSKPDVPAGDETYEIISTVTPTYDQNGRITGANRSGGGESVGAKISYDGFGKINRQEAPDGTITRNVYDQRGRLMRTYRGTNDACFWSHWSSTLPSTDPNDPGEPTDCLDTMVLVEKRYYGIGVTDADELVCVRHFRDRPTFQYNHGPGDGAVPDDPPDAGEPLMDDPISNEDQLGWTTEYEYDWRMRPVWVRDVNADGTPLRHTLTWYDNLDREVLVAEFGSLLVGWAQQDPPVLPLSIDPRSVGPDWSLAGDPTLIHDLLTNMPAPTSLTEHVYNARGQIEETRRWEWLGDHAACTATRNYYDHAGRPVEVHAPGTPVQRYTYDPKGRQILSESVAAGVVVSKTATTYDANDKPTSATHYDLDARDPQQNTYVTTYSTNSYDETGRLLNTCNFGNFETGDSLLTEYYYDEVGRQVEIHNPDLTVTRNQYDALGRLRLTAENADDRDDDGARRFTVYRYDDHGRLDAMAALPSDLIGDNPNWTEPLWDDLPWTVESGMHITTFEYDATVYRGTWDPGRQLVAQSQNSGWISRVTYPGETPGTQDYLEFGYYSDGSVAFRRDSRGIEFLHQYDSLGRRTTTWIDDSAYFPGTAAWEPANRANLIQYTYDAAGRLAAAAAWNIGEWFDVFVVESRFTYDRRGNLTREQQQHFGLVGPNSPAVQYTWEFADADNGNYDRLVSTTYPDGRIVRLDYGAATNDPVSDALSRVTAVTDGVGNPYGVYGYLGLGRRVSTALGNGVVQSFGGELGQFPGLDQWGRVDDLEFAAGGQTLYRAEHSYDNAGNRLHSRITQQAADGTLHANDRSYLYTYDALSRLIGAHLGQLNSTDDAIVPNPAVALARKLSWTLDEQGNWIGPPGDPPPPPAVLNASPGLVREDDTTGDGLPDATRKTWQPANAADQLQQIITAAGVGGTPPAESEVAEVVHDRAGNLVYDGWLFYQYDAFNRLTQVNVGRDAATVWIDHTWFSDGRLVSTATPGPLLARFHYDALGRLMRTERFDRANNAQTEDYYYDGVRRLYTATVTDPAAGDPETTQMWFVWGPGYVDELICQMEQAGATGTPATTYVLQDAGFDVVAFLSSEPGGTMPGVPDVLMSLTYDPYGNVVFGQRAATLLPSAARNLRIGHKGLFFERFYVDPTDSLLTDPPLEPGAVGLYYNRNRWYSPTLGRFTSRDREGAGLPRLIELVAGPPIAREAEVFTAFEHYAQGVNLHEYLGSNPPGRLDPMGGGWKLTGVVTLSVAAGIWVGHYKMASALGVPVGGGFVKHMVNAVASRAVGGVVTSMFTKWDPSFLAAETADWIGGVATGGIAMVLGFCGGFEVGMLETLYYLIENNLF